MAPKPTTAAHTMTKKRTPTKPKKEAEAEAVQSSEDEGMDVDTPLSSEEEEEETSTEQQSPQSHSKPAVPSGSGLNVNAKAGKARLMQENDFVSGILGHLHIPKHKNQKRDDQSEDEDDQVEMSGANARKLFASRKDRAKSVGELRERFNAKMKELRGQKSDDEDEDEEGKKKKKKKKGKLTKLERREKAKMEKKLKKKLTTIGAGAKGNNAKNALAAVKGAQKKGAGNQVKPVYNSEGKMVFSKFDFTEEAGDKKKQQLDPKSALKKLQKSKEKVKSLEASGKTDKVQNIAEKTAWKTALDKAEGVKVKDDEGLLKKSIKKLEQRKKSSKKKWEGRTDGVEKRKEGKQKKRAENLQQRKATVKQNKLKKAAKRGRTAPGFK